jgi:hypothetical protein
MFSLSVNEQKPSAMLVRVNRRNCKSKRQLLAKVMNNPWPAEVKTLTMKWLDTHTLSSSSKNHATELVKKPSSLLESGQHKATWRTRGGATAWSLFRKRWRINKSNKTRNSKTINRRKRILITMLEAIGLWRENCDRVRRENIVHHLWEVSLWGLHSLSPM